MSFLYFAVYDKRLQIILVSNAFPYVAEKSYNEISIASVSSLNEPETNGKICSLVLKKVK